MGRNRENTWFRFPVGTITSPAIREAARATGQPLSNAGMAWVSVLEHATSHSPPGSVETLRADIMSVTLDIEEEEAQALLDHFVTSGMIVDGKVANWWKLYDPANLRSATKGWRDIRKTVFERDRYACVYCGRCDGQLECDHVLAISRGGPSVLSNLVTACIKCNRSKGDMTPEEWLGGAA